MASTLLDHHRAFLDAGAAGGAGPEGLGIHQGLALARNDRQVRNAGVLADGLPDRASEVAGIAAALEADHHVLDQLLGD